MTSRRPPTRKIPPAPVSKSGLLHEIAQSLAEWAPFNVKGVPLDVQCGDQAKATGRRALRLMHDSLSLLNECKAKYGCRYPLGLRVDWLQTAASWPDPTDLGEDENWQMWGAAFTWRYPCGRSFIDEVSRWAEAVDKEDPPLDLISSVVAIRDYWVSRPTLRRAVAKGHLTDYRRKGHAENAPLRLSRTEVSRIWPPRTR